VIVGVGKGEGREEAGVCERDRQKWLHDSPATDLDTHPNKFAQSREA
jgi:hypothetical protein